MGHTVNSIIINAPYEKVFALSNDIARWKEFFDEYKESEIIEKNGNKIVFQLTNNEGNSWRSYRLLFKEDRFTYASRLTPMFPFVFMKIIWLYQEKENGIELTWIQDFQMDPKAKFTDQQVEQKINEHSLTNLKHFKEIIEAAD